MPDKSQIVYIRVPRNDYTVLISPDVENEKNGNTVSKFINRAAGFLRLFE